MTDELIVDAAARFRRHIFVCSNIRGGLFNELDDAEWRALLRCAERALSPQPPAETGDDDAEWLLDWAKYFSPGHSVRKRLEAIASRLSHPKPDSDVVETAARAIAAEIDAIDAEMENVSALAMPCRDEFRKQASERIATAALNAIFRDGDPCGGISASDQAASA